ncbi:MAG TPA: hypothetical protein ENK36_01580 [Desulfobacterales bacterium]|nr:hypothetical protein [Desulfobacterales bacterium]
MTIATLKSLFIGVGGSMILAVFCSTFIAMDKILFILPVFIAFNGAMTGYRMVEVLKIRIMNIPLFSFVLGVGGGALTFVAVNFTINFVRPYMGNTVLLNITDLFIYMTVSGITSYLGAKLAVRYFNL